MDASWRFIFCSSVFSYKSVIQHIANARVSYTLSINLQYVLVISTRVKENTLYTRCLMKSEDSCVFRYEDSGMLFSYLNTGELAPLVEERDY